MENDPVFDFSVPDWEYCALLIASVGVQWAKDGEIDIMAMFYKDGLLKSKARLRFPSGNKMVAEKVFPNQTLEEAINYYLSLIDDLPKVIKKSRTHTVIKNTTTKGQDLFDLLSKSPDVELTYTPLSQSKP